MHDIESTKQYAAKLGLTLSTYPYVDDDGAHIWGVVTGPNGLMAAHDVAPRNMMWVWLYAHELVQTMLQALEKVN